jgi:hypothetical protein
MTLETAPHKSEHALSTDCFTAATALSSVWGAMQRPTIRTGTSAAFNRALGLGRAKRRPPVLRH